jgi:uncharacterized membrane protein YfcA
MAVEYTILAAVLLLAGFSSGLIAGLLGVGGGIILVPVLFQTFIFFDLPTHLQIHMAVGTSLAIICFTGTQSARSHFKRDAVDVAVLKSWGGFIAVGALVGAVAARFIAPVGLKIIFATLALTMAMRMLTSQNGGEAGVARIGQGVQKALATLIGFFSALMGIGGGTLSVPLLNASGHDVHRAVGTSSVLGVVIAVPASLGFIIGGWSVPDLPPTAIGYVNYLAFLVMIPASMAGAPFGAKLAHRLSKKALNMIFAGFLLLSGGRMVLAIFG